MLYIAHISFDVRGFYHGEKKGKPGFATIALESADKAKALESIKAYLAKQGRESNVFRDAAFFYLESLVEITEELKASEPLLCQVSSPTRRGGGGFARETQVLPDDKEHKRASGYTLAVCPDGTIEPIVTLIAPEFDE